MSNAEDTYAYKVYINKIKIFLCSFLVLFTLLAPQNSYATLSSCAFFAPGINYDGTARTYPDGTKDTSGNDVSGQEITDVSVKRPGMLNKIITCIEEKVDRVTAQSLQIFQEDMKDVTIALLVMYIMFFGVLLALGGVRNHGAEAAVIILHVVIVGYFITSTGVSDYIIMIKEAVKIAIDTVSKHLTLDPLCPQTSIWLRLDCTAANIIGVSKIGSTTPLTPDELASFADNGGLKVEYTLLKIFAGLTWSSLEGWLYAILIALIVIFLIAALVQSAITYIISLIVITFLGIIAPLIIPTILFKKTQRYFEYWLRVLLGFILTPVLTLAYLAFMIQAITFALNMNCIDGIGKCGLKQIYQDVREGKIKHERVALLVVRGDNEHFQTRAENCDPMEKQQGDECAGLYFPSIKDQDKLILRNLAVMALLLSLTFSFLQNVMAFGARMAGMGVASPSSALKVYNRATARVGKILNHKR